MGVYDLWTHGTSVQVEYPDRVKYIRRAGWGTNIRQEHGSSNWYHFAIPTPTIINNDRTKYGKVWLKADTGNKDLKIDNRDTFIPRIDVWDNNSRIKIFDSAPLGLSPWQGNNCGPINFEGQLPEGELKYGLVICVNVKFEPYYEEPETNLGEIWFKTAGARFVI